MVSAAIHSPDSLSDEEFRLQTIVEDAASLGEYRRKLGMIHIPGDPVASAVRFVARSVGAGVGAVPRPKAGESGRQRYENLLAGHGLLVRAIKLQGEWWRTLRMPLFVTTTEGAVQAVIPTGRAGALLYDPKTDTARRLTSAVAQTLQPYGELVYRALRDDRVGLRKVLALGLANGWKDLILVLVFGVLGALVGLLTPVLTNAMISVAIPEGSRPEVVELAGLLAAVAIAVAVFQLLQANAVLRLETNFEGQAQGAVWDRLLHLPARFFRRYSAGHLAQRMMGISSIRSILSQGVAIGMLGGAFALINFIAMIAYGGWLSLVAVGATLVTMVIAWWAAVIVLRRSRAALAAQDELAGMTVQTICGIDKLRVAAAERRAVSGLLKLLAGHRANTHRARLVEARIASWTTVLPLLATCIFFAMIEFDQVSFPETGHFVAFLSAFGSFIVGLTGLAGSGLSATIGIVMWERLRPILEEAPDTVASDLPVPTLSGRVEVSHVNLRYREDGPPVLHDLSLKVEPGQFVAIVGESGSGKSSLMRVLLGLETPTDGAVLYDGEDIANLDGGAVRRQCGVVLQNMPLLGGSIFDNIQGSRQLSIDEAWAAAEKAGIAETIRAMPMQMNTVVNSDRTISGGERQRLLLAHAVAGNPAIICLDEATSALDNATQASVTKALSETAATRIVIAHRLSTILESDIVYVMDRGRIVESGTVEALMESGGKFAELAERQIL